MGEKSSSSKGRKQLTVVSSRGTEQRFLRGMVTHDLVQRGLPFDDAYAVARAVRDELSEREEVTTAEIRDLIQQRLEEMFGPDLPASLTAPARTAPDLYVVYHGQKQPFSRGLLATSIHAAGLDLDRAYRLVTELEGELRGEGVSALSNAELARRVGDLLEREESGEAARRYRLVRRVHRLPRPLVIYIGGASGTGKSTLALELAPLLRIYRINATDTIRQVMRMVFSQAILPAIHTSSFELPGGAGALGAELPLTPHHPDFTRRVTATYEEQATRVCVGVRAVVERAITERMSILVEGVHLAPSLVPFADLEGAVYQVPLILSTLNEEIHRQRFLARARLGTRRADRYLESFAAIRVIHDLLVQQAEAQELPLLDTSQSSPPVKQSLRMITSLLQRRLPDVGEPEQEGSDRTVPGLLVIIDGMADRPVRALGGRTPLQAAETPNLDRLAREGRTGIADPVAPGVVPDTAAGTLALFGQSPLAMKRGPVEALGAGLDLEPGDVALRGNFATLDDDGRVIDRRAGRLRGDAAKIAPDLDRLPLPGDLGQDLEVRVRASTEHRLAVVLHGEGLSSAISGSDPGDGAPPGPPLTPRPLNPDDERAVYTARALALFEQEARKVLADHPVNKKRIERDLPPANAVLTRGAGRIHRLEPLEEKGLPLRLTCISGDRTVLGIASWLGAEALTSGGMTANLDTDLKKKFKVAGQALEHNDLVILHLKGADIAAHDRRPDLKMGFIEKVDKELGRLLDARRAPLRIAVASDHATLSESGQHAADALPVLVWGTGIEPDSVETFDEQTAGAGALQRFPLQLLLSRLFHLT